MQEKAQKISPIKQRILQFSDSLGISKRDFYKQIGVSRGTLESKTGITEDVMAKFIATFPGISTDWLVKGEGEIFSTKTPKNTIKSNDGKMDGVIDGERKLQKTLSNQSGVNVIAEPQGNYVVHGKDDQEQIAAALPAEDGIPLIPLDAVAGFCNGNSAQVMEYECEKYVIPSFRGAEFLMQVKGSSMYPKYSSGDIVACKCLPLGTFFQWNKVYVVDTEQGVLIKRVRRGPDDNHITLVSENERYEPFLLHRESIHALAIVIGVIRLE